MALPAALAVISERLNQSTRELASLGAFCNLKTGRPMARKCATNWTCTIINKEDSLLQPTLRPRLPVEILDNIFSFTAKDTLRSLLVANSFVSALARRCLYHHVVLTRPKPIVAFLKSVLQNDRLGIVVRSLDLNITKSMSKHDPVSGQNYDDPFSRPMPTFNFYLLLNRALRSMRGLVSLSLELPKTPDMPWLLDGCTFRLRQFTTSLLCRRPLAQFLETQNTIVDLTLRGYQSDALTLLPLIGLDTGSPAPPVTHAHQFKLTPEALPRLRALNVIHADASLVQSVVEGRPVEAVSLPLFPGSNAASLDALQLASTPLRRLNVISFDTAAPNDLLEAISTKFKDLDALHVAMLMAECSQEMLVQATPLLRNFAHLKYITFMAPHTTYPNAFSATVPPPINTGPPTASAANQSPGANASTSNPTANADDAEEGTIHATNAGEEDIAKQWHRACPTLRTIILPQGRVWFRERKDWEGCTHVGCCVHRRQEQVHRGTSSESDDTAPDATQLDSDSPMQTEVETNVETSQWLPL